MVYAIILAGGKGERFWPLSREAKPKQFLSLAGKKSFLRGTFDRLKPEFGSDKIYVVTHASYKGKVGKELPELSKKNIIGEPLVKNTAAPILLVARFLLAKDPQAVMVILPSDHIVKENKKFLRVISAGVKAAQKSDCLVTIGIKPRYAATGYGYLKINAKLKIKNVKFKMYKVERFVEKPDRGTALKFLNNKGYLWNSGMFVFKASAISEAIKKYIPSLYSGLAGVSVKNILSRQTLSEAYSGIRAVSIDYGVMEKANNIYAIEGDFFWDDIGSWAAMERVRKRDKTGNIVIGKHKGLDTKNSTIVCGDGHLVGTLGISDIIIVRTRDATLVCHKDKAEDIKKLVKKLDKRFK